MGLVVPAVLPSSYKELEEELALLAGISSVSRIQIDVVDGLFASPASWPYTAHVGRLTSNMGGEMLPFLDKISYEIDLMCLDAENAVKSWLALGASRFTLHVEASTNLPRLLAYSKKRYGGGFAQGLVSFGCAINIMTDSALIEQCIGEIEYVQFMGIAEIGRQGQPFDKRVLEKIKTFRAQHPEITLQVDGGVTLQNASDILRLGVSDLIVGSAIVRARNPVAAFAEFESLKTPYGV